MEKFIQMLRGVKEKGKKVIILAGRFPFVGTINEVKINGYGVKVWLSNGSDMLIPHDDYVKYEKQEGKRFFMVTSKDNPHYITTFII
jgi:hypothetical protein